MKTLCYRFLPLAIAASMAVSGSAQTGAVQGAEFEMASQRAILANPNLEYAPYTIIIRFEPGTSTKDRQVLRGTVDATFVRSLAPALNMELLGTTQPEAAVAFLSALPGVQYAELDYVVRTTLTPNDPSYSSLWGLHNTGQTGGVNDADIDAPEAWDVFTGDPNFVIADIDTGVDYTHPDLAANSWINPGEISGNLVDDDGNGFIDDTRGWDFVSNDNNPIDDNNHGTHTAGTIGAVGNNGVGVVGVNWQCKIMALKFLNSAGSGSTSGAISCLNYAVQKGVKISNNSWGGGGFSQALFDSINAARTAGHLFIAAAGNNGANNDASPFYPATYNLDNIISVASIASNDTRSSFSNYGLTTVDLGAPGSAILSTVRGAAYSSFNGTSMATPHVAGVAALVYALNPTWTYGQVRNRLFSTVRPTSAMNGITVTGGVVNAAAAVGTPPTNTAPTVTITSPSSGSSFLQGTTVTFTGSGSDAQDGNVTAGLAWVSNIQGLIGNGGSFSRNDLVVGTHVVTASVTDSGGLTGSASVTVTITAPNPIPNAPSNLTASAPTSGVARLNWSDNSNNETNFDIERQRRVGNTWTNTTVITVGANVTTLDDAAGSGRFRYRVRSRNASGSSVYTAYVQIRL